MYPTKTFSTILGSISEPTYRVRRHGTKADLTRGKREKVLDGWSTSTNRESDIKVGSRRSGMLHSTNSVLLPVKLTSYSSSFAPSDLPFLRDIWIRSQSCLRRPLIDLARSIWKGAIYIVSG